MTNTGWLLVVGFVVMLNVVFNVIAFLTIQGLKENQHGMLVDMTRLQEDRNLFDRIARGEEFARTFCLDGKLQACAMLGPVKR